MASSDSVVTSKYHSMHVPQKVVYVLSILLVIEDMWLWYLYPRCLMSGCDLSRNHTLINGWFLMYLFIMSLYVLPMTL